MLPAITSKAINAYLNLDPESQERLTKLQGKVITIEFLPMHFVFQCIFSEDSVTLQKDNLLENRNKTSWYTFANARRDDHKR